MDHIPEVDLLTVGLVHALICWLPCIDLNGVDATVIFNLRVLLGLFVIGDGLVRHGHIGILLILVLNQQINRRDLHLLVLNIQMLLDLLKFVSHLLYLFLLLNMLLL